MKAYRCPMHPEIERSEPGFCLRCRMRLMEVGGTVPAVVPQKNDYTPLVVIAGIILAAIGILAYKNFLGGIFSWHGVMMHSMASLFIVFAGFKLLDLKGFALAYAAYDLIAARFRFYGYVYPFLELCLGLLYLGGVNAFALNLFTFVLMVVNGTGVLVKLAKKESFQCACLGTFLKVPLTKVSLAEDFGMAMMALAMLLM